ncbi:MAG: hypothetical protein ACLFTR_00145 [Candidatus Woesearchaeota archaeon]
MAERRKVVDTRKLSYSGLFDGKEIYKLIKEQVADLGYDTWLEREHNEKTGKSGKQVELAYLPKLKVSDYIELQLGVKIVYKNLNRTSVKYKGKSIKVDEGDLEIEFEGYIHSDYFQRWDKGANNLLIRTIMDKFIFKSYYNKYQKMLERHIKDLYNHIRQYLNTTKQE